MKKFKTIGWLVFVAMYCHACGSSKNDKLTEIKTMEDELFSDETQMIDRQKANDLIAVYESFADEFPEDSETPVYLFKAGDMAMNLNMPRKAIDIFDKMLNKYP